MPITAGRTQLIKKDGLKVGDEVPCQRAPEYVVLLRALLARSDYEAALALSERLLRQAETAGWVGLVIEVLILKALSHQGQKDPERALKALGKALSLAMPEGYVRLLLDEGEPMTRLLCQAQTRKVGAGYEAELLSRIGTISGMTQPSMQLLVEPLTPREMEVLKLIEAGASNQEISRPPKEYAVIGTVLYRLYLPPLKLQFPEVVDFSLPMEAVSYRIAVVSIKKEYPGHARRIMMGLWGILKQFTYVKYIIVVDEDIDVHNWADVVWAISTRVDPKRDSFFVENTPIDYLDFSSPLDSLGSKMGIDATNKYPPEVTRRWGETMKMDKAIVQLVDRKWKDYGF